MKKIVYLLVICLVPFLGKAQNAKFDALKELAKASVSKEYSMNEAQTNSSRFSCQVTYDRDNTGSNRLIFNYYNGSDAFSDLSLNMDHELFDYQGRKALFLDGSKTGMSGLQVILSGGRFDLTHRTFDGTAMDREALLEMLKRIDLGKLE